MGLLDEQFPALCAGEGAPSSPSADSSLCAGEGAPSSPSADSSDTAGGAPSFPSADSSDTAGGGDWEHDWKEKADGGAKGCPGYIDPDPYFESRGCCLGEYDDWCNDNYAGNTRCENNACVNSDCCVPAVTIGAIIGGVVAGLIFLICIASGVIAFIIFMKNKNARRSSPASPAAMPMVTATAVSAVTVSATPSVSTTGYPVNVPYGGATAVPCMAVALTPVTPMENDSVATLAQLKDMLDKKLITQAEFHAKKAEILARM